MICLKCYWYSFKDEEKDYCNKIQTEIVEIKSRVCKFFKEVS